MLTMPNITQLRINKELLNGVINRNGSNEQGSQQVHGLALCLALTPIIGALSPVIIGLRVD